MKKSRCVLWAGKYGKKKRHILIHLTIKSWHHVSQYAYICFICWKLSWFLESFMG